MSGPLVDPAELREAWKRRPASCVRQLVTLGDRPPFTSKAAILRALREGDQVEIAHHVIPENSRVAMVLGVSTYQLVLSAPATSTHERSYVEWPRAGSFRVNGPASFSLLTEDGNAWITFRLIG